MKIAIFYHTLYFMGNPPTLLPGAYRISAGQMHALRTSGLMDAADEFHVGINGGEESARLANVILPAKASVQLHGLQCRNECRTIRMIEEWIPAHQDYLVCYFHCKGATHPIHDPLRSRWRDCLMRHVILNWRKCVALVEAGYDSVGCHWMTPPATPAGQLIWAGNFWWAKASYLATLPSIMLRDRIKVSGLDSIESRYESEVWIGFGPRPPKVYDFHPSWNPSKVATCST